MGYSSKQTCPRCGRVLVGFEPCPNCTAGGYSDPYQAYGQGVSSPTVGPRLVLLLGAIVLLSVMVFLIAPRGGSQILSSPTTGHGEESGESQRPATRIPASQKTDDSVVASPSEPKANGAEDDAFWRKKLEHDLREVGEYTPTAEEKAYWEQMRWQDHFSLSDQTRTSDYYLRRPELTGNRR